MSSYTVLAEAVPLEQGTSPDGRYRLEVVGLEEPMEGHILKLRERKTNAVAGSRTIVSYAGFPQVADPLNIACFWAPDSEHFALMVRDSKRTWSVGIYTAGKAIRALPTPELTRYALKQVRQDSIFRWSRETPIRWIDKGHLFIRLEGDCGTAPDIIRYSGEISLSISDGKVTLTKPFTSSKEEG